MVEGIKKKRKINSNLFKWQIRGNVWKIFHLSSIQCFDTSNAPLIIMDCGFFDKLLSLPLILDFCSSSVEEWVILAII